MHGHSFQANVAACLPDGWGGFVGAEVDALRCSLSAVVDGLDYTALNDKIDLPTNENIARWIGPNLDLPVPYSIGVHIGSREGVDMDGAGIPHVWRLYRFESAHFLPQVPGGHKCGRMHGHSFSVVLHVQAGPSGADSSKVYDDMDACWSPFYEELDHCCLNDIPGLENPTSEILAAWLWDRIKPELPGLSWVTVYETSSCCAHYNGKDYRIWKEMSFDSAVQLQNAPENDGRRRIHGHTYRIKLHLQAPLDKVMGWIVDYGDVKSQFNPLFTRLDHVPLYELDGLADANAGSLVRWVKTEAQPLLPELVRIVVMDASCCGGLVRWGGFGPVRL